MSDDPERDRLFLQVGRTLTAWNEIEEGVLSLLEYAHSHNGIVGPEISVGYWAVVSFEARLRWCNSVVELRTRFVGYEELAAEWKTLANQMTAKARKRAEVAHGSVKSIYDARRNLVDLFVPYFHKQMMEFRFLPYDRHIATPLEKHLKSLSLSDLKAREDSFRRVAHRLQRFRRDWGEKDKQTGYSG